MTTRGISVAFGDIAQTPPPTSPTVIGLVGDGTAGSPVAALATPVAVSNRADAETQFGTAGTLIDACRSIFAITSVWVIGVRYDSTLTGADLSGAVTDAINALLRSEVVTGFHPTLIAAPELSYDARDDGAANSNATLMNTVAESLGAYAVVDAANSDIATAKTWSTNNGAPRLIAIPQTVTTPDTDDLPGSSFLVGAIAANDAENGVRDSISNRVLLNIVSVKPTYTFSYIDSTSEAVDLDTDAALTTVVRTQGAWRAWGGQTSYGSLTDLRRFANIGRVIDQIEDRVVLIAQRMVDRGIRFDFVNRLVSNVQDYLDVLVAGGDLSSGVASPDPVQNTPESLAQGRVYLQLQIQPVPNASLITLTIHVG